MSVKLSENFTLPEFIDSDTAVRLGIKNVPGYVEMGNLYYLAERMEAVREALGDVPILISSGYRSPALNAAIGGSPTSAHCKGLAVDFRAPAFGTPLAIAQALAPRVDALQIDQMIHEGRWVHCGFAEPEGAPRGQVLTADFTPSGVRYRKGLL